MSRKFRLCQKKKHYAASSLPVSIPLDKVKVDSLSLQITIPREVFLSANADCLETLQRRLTNANVEPDGMLLVIKIISIETFCYYTGWSRITKHDQLCYFKMHVSEGIPSPLFITIGPMFTWQLYYCGTEVLREKCSLLASVPATLSTVAGIKCLFSLLPSSKPCRGNPDERFLSLSANRDGGFWNSTGIYL